MSEFEAKFDLILKLTSYGATMLITYYTYKYLAKQLGPSSSSSSILAKLENHPNISQLKKIKFDERELSILQCLTVPDKNDHNFTRIGGLVNVIDDLKSIFNTFDSPNLHKNSELFSPPKGILLHGPPGTGKTMLAKAIANHYNFNFLNINNSDIESKYYGETEKQINAIFTLAKKIQPTVIFFDEIDSVTGKRNHSEMEVNLTKKSILLQLWDGITSGNDKIIIIGATNRPKDIDTAFHRRLPKQIHVKLPDTTERKNILEIILKGNVEDNFNYEEIADKTPGLSGSDLKEISKLATITAINRSPTDPKLNNSDFTKPIEEFLVNRNNNNHVVIYY